uniref:7TM_GPCR_Srx domain-containing protein n=1 Tax=Steinernema glaseri TaxID=37863 RepID=A0A1I7YTR5_9BILA
MVTINLDVELITLIFGILYLIIGIINCCAGSLIFCCREVAPDEKFVQLGCNGVVKLIVGTLTVSAIVYHKSWMLWPIIILVGLHLLAHCIWIATCCCCGQEDNQAAIVMVRIILIALDIAFIFILNKCTEVLDQKHAEMLMAATNATTVAPLRG